MMLNDPIKLELMKHVERAVRPVAATHERKMQMRRELLGHLAAAYEDELARDGDPAAAVERAAQRLGAPADLTRRLQGSVGRVEAWRARNAMQAQRRPGESLPRNALRWAGFFLVIAIVSLSVTLVSCAVVGWLVPSEDFGRQGLGRFFYAAGFLMIAYPLAGAMFACLSEILPRIASGSLWLLGLGWFISSSLFVSLPLSAILGWASERPLFIFEHFDVLAGPCLLAPAIFAACMVGVEIGRRRRAEWEELEIA